MREEQTIYRNVKTSGSIKQFTSSSSTVEKWCLNRYFLYLFEEFTKQLLSVNYNKKAFVTSSTV